MRINPDLDDFFDVSPAQQTVVEKPQDIFIQPVITTPVKTETVEKKDPTLELLQQIKNKLDYLEIKIDTYEKNNKNENNLRIMLSYKVWYVYKGTKEFGPFSMKQIQEGIRTNKISETDRIWCMQLGSSPTLANWKSVNHDSVETTLSGD